MTGQKWFEGIKDAPEGTIPDVGHSGPGVKVLARDEAHAERIKATGFYKPSTAPKEDKEEAVEQSALQTPDAKDGAKAGK
ncbi:hypothetical protein ACFFLM_04405 [Deinococcus oregonensis]|uniref:Uncharacterized protein n=1 Tax=Deinococcus oregonensis TaxID=1805970 RepID=A0ABV6AUQ0_9DEIO